MAIGLPLAGPLLDHVNEGVVVLDAAGQAVFANRAARQAGQDTPDAEAHALAAAARQAGEEVVHDAGAWRKAVPLEDGSVALFLRFTPRSSASRIRELFEHVPMDLLLLQVRPGGVVIEQANPAFCRTTGYVQADIAGQAIDSVFETQTAGIMAADCRASLVDGSVDLPRTLRFPRGERAMRTAYRALPGGEPELRRVLLTQIDLTERRQIETALRQALRLEVIGQLTGGVAHDFNNLLTAILGNLELLKRKVTDERQLRWVRTATDAAHRGATLTQQLLSYARKQFLAPKATDIPAALGGMLELIRGSVGASITLSTDFHPQTWPAHADIAQLELALLNLVVNARTAMPQGGRLLLATRNVPPGDPDLPPELEPGAYVLVSATDDGVGMAPEVLAQAMEPFFTTKGIGEGSGLGLSQAYGFARQLGGTVRMRSTVNTGTTAEIFLPRAVPSGSVRLLLVDDNAGVRSAAAELLRDEGWLIDEAAGGQAALDLMATHRYAVLLADLQMPGMSGVELARAAAGRQPHLYTVFLSGNADPALDASLPGPLLTKPYAADDLVAAVRAGLARWRG